MKWKKVHRRSLFMVRFEEGTPILTKKQVKLVLKTLERSHINVLLLMSIFYFC